MKETASNSPGWMDRARGAWSSVESPPPCREWTAYWIRKFVVYLERRNKGVLPELTPSMGTVASFCRFIEEKWEVEEWQLEQARVSLHWFGVVAGFSAGRAADGGPEDGGRGARDCSNGRP